MARRRGGYQVGWSVAAGCCLALGAAVTVLVDTLGALVVMAVMATAIACLLAVAAKESARPVRFVARNALLVLLVLAGVNGLAIAVGAVTYAVVAVLLVTGIPLVWPRRGAEAGSGPEPEPVAPPPPPPPPKTVIPPPQTVEVAEEVDEPESTAAICWTWRTSFSALRKADGLDERLRIVELRQHCLDELARREPAGFHKWLAAGARAAGDPTRYVCAPPKRHPS